MNRHQLSFALFLHAPGAQMTRRWACGRPSTTRPAEKSLVRITEAAACSRQDREDPIRAKQTDAKCDKCTDESQGDQLGMSDHPRRQAVKARTMGGRRRDPDPNNGKIAMCA